MTEALLMLATVLLTAQALWCLRNYKDKLTLVLGLISLVLVIVAGTLSENEKKNCNEPVKTETYAR